MSHTAQQSNKALPALLSSDSWTSCAASWASKSDTTYTCATSGESHRVAQLERRAAFALRKHFMREPKRSSLQKVSSAKPRLLWKAFKTTFKDHSGKQNTCKTSIGKNVGFTDVSLAKPICSGSVQSKSASPHYVFSEKKEKTKWI